MLTLRSNCAQNYPSKLDAGMAHNFCRWSIIDVTGGSLKKDGLLPLSPFTHVYLSDPSSMDAAAKKTAYRGLACRTTENRRVR